MSDYDVIVVGGAMVGSAAAALLGIEGLRVAVVEAGTQQIDLDDQFIDLRVSAISRASQGLLQQLAVWQKIDPARMSPYREMRVWDGGVPPESAEVLHFDSADIAEPDLGFIVENRRILHALRSRIDELETVVVFAPASAGQIKTGDDAIEVRLDDGRRLRARLLIAADGARSAIRELAGISTTGWSYEQKAVVTHITTDQPHGDTAFQRFLPDGPVALLPLYDGRSSVVWSTTPTHANNLLELEANEFNEQMTAATDRVLGDIVASDRRAAFPLQLLHADAYVRPRLVLLGDAAHAVHPLAGQGVNLGFADVAVLGRVLANAQREVIGDWKLLRRYERQRKSENLLMMGSIDALHRLFAQQTPLASRARQLGMSLFNRMSPLKQAVIRRAMGA